MNKNKYEKMSDAELAFQVNHAITVWQMACVEEEFKHKIVQELRNIQIERLMKKWKRGIYNKIVRRHKQNDN